MPHVFNAIITVEVRPMPLREVVRYARACWVGIAVRPGRGGRERVRHALRVAATF